MEHFTVIEKKGRTLLFPAAFPLPAGGCALLFHDAPLREPELDYDIKSNLAVATAASPREISAASARPVPRFPWSGYSPSVSPAADGLFALTDTSWNVINWMGQAQAIVIEDVDWTISLRGGYFMLIDASGEELRFGKPRRIHVQHYPLLSVFGPAIHEGGDSFLCICDYNVDCSELAEKPWDVLALRTTDAGVTWEIAGRIYSEEEMDGLPRLSRSRAVKTADGEYLCAMLPYPREQSGAAPLSSPNIHFSRTTDAGASWSAPEPTGPPAAEFSLVRLEDGRLAMAALPPGAGRPIKLYISENSGATWPEELAIEVFPQEKEYTRARPHCAQMQDGALLVTCHRKTEKGGAAIEGAVVEP